jgi:hypothetical protein
VSGIGSAMTGSSSSGRVRKADDYYPTPADATRALLAAELPWLSAHTRVWEPACGEGAMSREIESLGFDVYSSDLIDRGYGDVVDFFATSHVDVQAIVTNPPFNLAEKFIVHALGRLAAPYLCLLLKSTFWHAARRAETFAKHPPTVLYPMTWRPDFLGLGAPTMEAMWCVWDTTRSGPTIYCPMHRQQRVEPGLPLGSGA